MYKKKYRKRSGWSEMIAHRPAQLKMKKKEEKKELTLVPQRRSQENDDEVGGGERKVCDLLLVMVAVLPAAYSLVALHVQWQMVRSWEGTLAQVAAERLLSRMFAEVTGQLVGPSKLPGTTIPRALVRFLAYSIE